ncbi:kinase-like domain-containing protein [Cercophora scortea]|uniref:Kinase-like domain-containing protein n=1 Tax=Cercophora scortea TaxID=314031 RepID=A0AAE0MK59_9PEZI|nr:kinase-like domain-containing protein [Cercophora scortea]
MAELASSPILSPQESFREFRDNGLRLDGSPTGLENVHDYEPGGHHPLHLGDVLNGRYKVLHKLGNGGYANIWLCRDVQREVAHYFAVKILMADASIDDCHELRVYRLLRLGLARCDAAEHLCLPIGRFDIQGPNGQHFALVFPVLGPRVSMLPRILNLEDSARTLRSVCFQVTKTIATLHSYGTCHGDLRPANILVQVRGLTGLLEEEIERALGVPETVNITRVSGKGSWPSTAPHYLVKPIEWGSVNTRDTGINFLTDRVCLVDFGESFDVRDVPEDLGVPEEYRAPEYILDKRVGAETDIWALGCTLFEIRTGKRLFDLVDDDPDDHLERMVDILGKFPEPWWSKTWEARRRYFREERDRDRRLSYQPIRNNMAATAKSSPRSIEEALLTASGYEQESIGTAVSPAEARTFGDLLRRIFKYAPEQRVAAEDLLDHGWFTM